MAATSMVLIFMVMFSELYQDNLSDKKRILAKDFGASVQNEIIVASETKPGYIRYFDVPEEIEGYDIELSIINSVLLVNYTDAVVVFNIPTVVGQPVQGLNKIENINDTICLNC
jgi:hypothetical protein